MLNDAKIRAAKPRAKAYKLTDSNRLYLLIKPSGSKLWKWNYAFSDKQKTMAFGSYPAVNLVDARAKRDDARALLDEGRDPAIVKRLKIEANLKSSETTFARVAHEWHKLTKGQWAARHADDVLRSLDRDVFPAIGPLPIAEISPPLVMDVLSAIEERGAIETAKRVRQRISAVFVYAIAKGMADKDPVRLQLWVGDINQHSPPNREPQISQRPASYEWHRRYASRPKRTKSSLGPSRGRLEA